MKQHHDAFIVLYFFAQAFGQAGTYTPQIFDDLTTAPESEIPIARTKLRAYDTAVRSRLIVSHSKYDHTEPFKEEQPDHVFTTAGRSGHTRYLTVLRMRGIQVLEDSVWFTSPHHNISYDRLNLTGRIRPDAATPIPSETSLLAPTNQSFLKKMEDILDFQQNDYYLSKDKSLLIIVNGSLVCALSRQHSYFPSLFQLHRGVVPIDAGSLRCPHIKLQVSASGFYFDANDQLHWPQTMTDSNWQFTPEGAKVPWFEVHTTIRENKAITESDLRAEIPNGYLILDEDAGTTSIVGAQ